MRFVVWALVVLLGSGFQTLLGHHTHNPAQTASRHWQGEWLKGLKDYDVVIPKRVDANGKPYPLHQSHFLHRTRRSVDSIQPPQEGEPNIQSPHEGEETFYSLQAFGRDIRLRLVPHDFIVPNLLVQYIGNGSTWFSEENATTRHCFYRGTVEGDPHSVVRLSLCHSMWGTIKTLDQHYIIEPHPNTSRDSQGTLVKPHVAYRLGDLPHYGNKSLPCGVKDNYKHERWKSSSEHSLNNATYRTKRRKKRSVSWERHVEVMVVADSRMYQYHGNDLTHYILTLMSMVSGIYKDQSIGNNINIVVVKLVIIKDDKDGPTITANAQWTLKNFCRWQQEANNPDDNSPEHHDTALLVTRQDICRSQRKCDTLGLAELGTMCDFNKSCSITEDNGMSAAFTIAHELGHVFNLPHDDDKKCRQFIEQKKGSYHVMAPTLDYNTNPWTWSKCSTKMLTEFLDAGYGECLLDKPLPSTYHTQMEAIVKPAGELYGVDQQCAQVFGGDSKICTYMPVCERLWCTSPFEDLGCRTQHMPWADGSRCGPNKWCRRGSCEYRRNLVKQDGTWSAWNAYGECSRTCGGGIKKGFRTCDNPVPKHGGKYCVGQRVRYKSCNTKNCPADSPSFRHVQCAKFNGRHFNINGLTPSVQWVPKYAGIQVKDRCKLFCRVSNSHYYYLLSDQVLDGTKCGPHTSDICVNGHCRIDELGFNKLGPAVPAHDTTQVYVFIKTISSINTRVDIYPNGAGCDNKLGSSMRRDKCGVCGGDNSRCQTISGTFNEVRYGYNSVVKIPKGAVNVDVRQYAHNKVKEDDNYLALKNGEGKYLLNGNFVVSMFRKDLDVQGGKLEYSGSNHVVERINGSKMIGEEVEVQVLSVGKLYPPDIRYAYTISREDVPVSFKWSRKHGPWSTCSSLCQGYRRRKVVCIRRDDKRMVSDVRCERESRRKPKPITRKCNRHCNVGWQIVEQTECSARCGQGMQLRKVKCVRRMMKSRGRSSRCPHGRHCQYVDDRECARAGRKPADRLSCTGLCHSSRWSYTAWGECSKHCGRGVQHREAACVDARDKRLPDSRCNGHKITTQRCNTDPCPKWVEGDWTGCSVTCGPGFRIRQVWCKLGDKSVSKLLCDPKDEPEIKMSCSQGQCPGWYASYWGECSVTCSKGVKQRAVKCRSSAGVVLKDTECDAATRPRDMMICYQPPCSSSQIRHTTTTPPAVRTQWRTGSWTGCSVTCGSGTRERYVSCRDTGGDIADDEDCAHTPKPDSRETCVLRTCGEWRTGEWTQCTVTCGTGKETRYVACVTLDDLEDQIAQHTECDVSVRPASERACNRQVCITAKDYDIGSISSNNVVGTSHWRVGPWGGCSSTCEGGWQRRAVVCHDEKGPSDQCDYENKPMNLQSCNSGPCPKWNFGEWGSCSLTCGKGGIQHRIVRCRRPDGETLADHSCDIMDRPVSSQRCDLGPCQRKPQWRKGAWSECSVSCGRGHKLREVKCADKDGQPVDGVNCKKRKPKTVRRCRRGRCPRWSTSEWTQCSASCGNGMRQREVKCMRYRNRIVEPAMCVNLTKPPDHDRCQLTPCGVYQWTEGDWSPCSKRCGYGETTRSIWCQSVTQRLKVDDHLCDQKSKPRRRRQCHEIHCRAVWVTGEWGQCSKSCGEGRHIRVVTCLAVTKEGWLLSGHRTTGCNETDKPVASQACKHGDCNSLYRWEASDWEKCSKECGYGQVTRKVFCVDANKRKHPRHHCIAEYKPPTAKLCYLRPCYSSSCYELKHNSSIRQDGTYRVMVKGKLIQVYCTGMLKSQPMTHLTLPAGEKENYSEIYEKRLQYPDTCPENGTRIGSCRNCFARNPYNRAGMSSFSKLQIDITSMKVILNDFTYSSTHGARGIPFATAGDCYSTEHCPQGRFKINLTGTGIRVANHSRWQTHGYKATKDITFSQDGQVVEGRCGGFCGLCSPHKDTGLQLELLP